MYIDCGGNYRSINNKIYILILVLIFPGSYLKEIFKVSRGITSSSVYFHKKIFVKLSSFFLYYSFRQKNVLFS